MNEDCRIIYAPAARRDLDQIRDYIAEDSLEAADRLLDLFLHHLELLAGQPEMGRSRPELGQGVRGFPIERYVVVYRPTADGIEVARVVHTARDIERLV